jgi:hypothetical protein
VRLGQHHQALGPARRVGAAEHGDAALAHAVDAADTGFDLLRVKVAPATDDDVLRAPGDVDLTVGAVGAVAAVEPVVVEQPCGLLRIAKVAMGCRRAAELEPALGALTDFAPLIVDQPRSVSWQRRTAGNEAQRTGIIGSRRQRAVLALEGLALDVVDPQGAPERREQQAEAGLGQAVHWRDRARTQAATCEALLEALHCVGADRFGAVEGHAPATQVDPGQRRVVDALDAQLVGEVRRCRQAAAIAVDGLQPTLGARQKGQRRHHHQRIADIQRAEPRADQPHVVV